MKYYIVHFSNGVKMHIPDVKSEKEARDLAVLGIVSAVGKHGVNAEEVRNSIVKVEAPINKKAEGRNPPASL